MMVDAAGALWLILDVSLRALAAAAAVALVLTVLRVREAAVRHAAWSAVLMAMFVMPLLPSSVRALPVPVPAGAGHLFAVAPESIVPSSPAPISSALAARGLDAVPSPPAGDSVRSRDRSAMPVLRASTPGSWLPIVLLGLYLTGMLFFSARLAYGWWLASAMIRRARRAEPIPPGVTEHVYQSPEVAVPMTVGAIRPVIVLPIAWRAWDAETLAAVLAHETAHVRRRDASINVVARLNRAMFWFHPLAWWLERTLAVTAEHVCDEAAARAIAAPRRYAEILVEMADVVRRNGGRLAWQAVGVNGAGHLDRRIERLLADSVFPRASRAKRIAAGVACILALATVIACRQQLSAAPLREDPELAKRMVEREQQTKQFEAARDLTQEQADALEERIAANPDDFDTRRQLVTYYRTSLKVAWDRKVPGLRRHALWLIEHHPEHEVVAPALSPQYDPEGFAAAKRLWQAHLAKPNAGPYLVLRAVDFFAPYDKPYAEQLILRGMAMDPDSAALTARMPPDVGAYQWPIQLSSLYGAAIRGSESVWGTYNDLRTHVEWVKSSYAMEVRQKLETTSDARLLSRVGEHLTRQYSTKDPAEKQALEEVRALGLRYLERALTLDPNLIGAKVTLVRIRLAEQATDADRFATKVQFSYFEAQGTEYYKKDPAAAKQKRDETKAYAEEVLKVAAAHTQDPAYAAAIMTAHQVLATIALREGDRERAVRHLRDSLNVPASEAIQYAPPFAWSTPVNLLLKEGERERVVEFLEAFARLTIVERERLLKDAQAIREGRMPHAYQSMIAREGR
jgi:hypothetical protein